MMQRIVTEDLLRYHSLSDLALSPGGDCAAYLLRHAGADMLGYESHLILFAAEGASIDTGVEAAAFFWLDDDVLLLALPPAACAEPQRTVLALYSRATGVLRPAADLPLTGVVFLGLRGADTVLFKGVCDLRRQARLHGLWGQARKGALTRIDEEAARFTIFDEFPYRQNGSGIVNGKRCGLYSYALSTGVLARLTDEGMQVEDAAYCPVTGRIAFSGYPPGRVRMHKEGLYASNGDEGFRELFAPGIRRIDRVLLWQGRLMLCVSMEKQGTSLHTPGRMVAVDWDGGEIAPFLAAPPYLGNPVICDVRLGGGRSMKPCGPWLYCLIGEAESSNLARIGVDGHIERLTDCAGSVDMFDTSAEETVCVAMDGLRLQELYRVESGVLIRLTAHNEAFIRTHQVIPCEPLFFENVHGDEIHGFVLKPADFDPAKSYPMILDIHGGPGLAYGTVFMHEMQLWAQHGYFVIFANPRGSGARGDAFHNLYGRFGTVDYDDLMQFTDLALARYPAIDPARLGVTGGSYGGFMTNWIIGHTDRFAAAASQRSVSNHITMEGISDMAGFTAEEMTLATPWTDIQRVWAASPLCYARRVKTPTLFIHAEEDYRCPAAEAIQMYTALAIGGIPVRMCLFKGENHELSRSGKPVNRIKRLEEITGWMDRYLMPEG